MKLNELETLSRLLSELQSELYETNDRAWKAGLSSGDEKTKEQAKRIERKYECFLEGFRNVNPTIQNMITDKKQEL